MTTASPVAGISEDSSGTIEANTSPVGHRNLVLYANSPLLKNECCNKMSARGNGRVTNYDE